MTEKETQEFLVQQIENAVDALVTSSKYHCQLTKSNSVPISVLEKLKNSFLRDLKGEVFESPPPQMPRFGDLPQN